MEVGKKLESMGYFPQDIRLKEKDKIRYVKASDKKGRTVYVDVDVEGEEVIEEGIVLPETISIIAPNSLVRGGLACVEPENQAVAVECEGGVCVFSREKRFNLEEKNFSSQHRFPQHRIPNSCPVIKYSELTANPSQVEKAVEISCERITVSEMKFCDSLVEETGKSIIEAEACWKRFACSLLQRRKELFDSLRELETYRMNYEKGGESRDLYCNEKYDALLWNIKARRAKLANLILMCKGLTETKETIDGIARELADNTGWIQKELSNLCYVIPQAKD